MSGDIIIGYCSRETSYSSSHHCNNYCISNDEILEVSEGDGKLDMGRLQLSTLNLANLGVYHSSYDCRGGYRSKETSHSFSRNLGVCNFGVGGRCVTRYQ